MYGDGSDVGLLGTDAQIISKFEHVSLVIKQGQVALNRSPECCLKLT